MCNGHCSCPLAFCSSSLTIQINNSANLYVICIYFIDIYRNSCQKYTRKFTCLTHCISSISLQRERVLGKYLQFLLPNCKCNTKVKKPKLQISRSCGHIHLVWTHHSSDVTNWQPTQKATKPKSVKGQGREPQNLERDITGQIHNTHPTSTVILRLVSCATYFSRIPAQIYFPSSGSSLKHTYL